MFRESEETSHQWQSRVMNAVVKTRPASTGGLEEAPGRLLGGGGWGERVEIRKGVHRPGSREEGGRREAGDSGMTTNARNQTTRLCGPPGL